MGTVNDRARVPFALVGVLVLVSSAGLTATVGTHSPDGPPAVDRAMEGATAEATTALRGAADDAATEAAAAPVTDPANTTAGAALDDSQPFRDALRLRLYLTARERLGGVEVRRGGVLAEAELPAVEPTTEGYREAIDRVSIEPAGEDDAALRVEIDGLRLTATRSGRTVATADRTPSFVVANPALNLHDRAERFDRRTTASVTRPGLAQRTTARLYPVAWTRGYAQYGGAPITTVLGTRHVELATNDALLAEQRAAFGTADPAGNEGVAAAGRRVATTDLLAGVGGDEAWTDEVLEAADSIGPDPPEAEPVGTWRDDPPSSTVTVGINESSDRAYAAVAGIDGDDDLERLAERAGTVEAELDVGIQRQGQRTDTAETPGDDWRLDGKTSDLNVSLTPVDSTAASREGWETRRSAAFDATEVTETTRTWHDGAETKTTRSVTEVEYRVIVSVRVRPLPIENTPPGRIDESLEEAAEQSAERALDDAGGVRTVAREAIAGDDVGVSATATADDAVDRSAVAADIRSIRERTRNHTVSVPAPAVGAGRANPPLQLGESLTDRRATLVGDAEPSPLERAKRAARSAYLDALASDLDERADRHEAAGGGIDEAIGEHLDTDRLDGALAAHRMATHSESTPPRDPAGNLSLAVETGPSYLTTGPVDRDRIDTRGDGSVIPLATRNVNVFTSPHAGAAESVFDRIPHLGTDRIALSTAAEALAAAEPGVSSSRAGLESAVEEATAHVRGRLVAAMVAEGVPERAAEDALETDAGTAETALLFANGTIIEMAASEVTDDERERDRLRVRMELAREEALSDEAARPPRATTQPVVEEARAAYSDELESLAAETAQEGGDRARQRVLGERLGALPAGLPVAPVPGYWYATTNVWYVESRGTYERFVVRADRGGPDGDVTYIRDGRTARMDVGEHDHRLGTATRISVEASTAVVVVVPPGGRGVGDTDGVVDERSAGWPS